VVGELDLTLGRFGDEKDLEETIMEIVGNSHNDEEFKDQLERMGDEIQDAREQYEKIKSLDESLFTEVTLGD
jgi:hypothetical protein